MAVATVTQPKIDSTAARTARSKSALLVVAAWLCATSASALAQPSSMLIDIRSVISDIRLDLRYAGQNNFLGRPVRGYDKPVCFLTGDTARALAAAESDFRGSGFRIVVYDCYRPRSAVLDFINWAHDKADTSTKSDYYPRIAKSDLFRLGYIARQSNHTRGLAVDISLVNAGSGDEVDMGSRFDLFDPLSQYHSDRIGRKASRNREILRRAMERAGFASYDKEWWHFTFARRRTDPPPSKWSALWYGF